MLLSLFSSMMRRPVGQGVRVKEGRVFLSIFLVPKVCVS